MSERKKTGTEADEADAQPAYEGDAFVSPVEVPTEESTEQPRTESLDIPAGHTALIYRGSAHVVRHGDYEFRPGKTVVVPDDVAEDLQTLPRESFEQVKE